MRKMKEIYEWCVAGAIVGFVGVSFIVGSLWTINVLVETICSIFGV